MTAADLDAAIGAVAAALTPAVDQDWRAVRGTGELTAWQTAEHLGDCLLSYAGQLVARPDNRYVRFEAVAAEDASAAQVLEFALAGGRILASVARTTEPQVRAHHPTGLADPAGFAAMGCVEMLVHGHDIALGLGVELDPPRPMCARVVARMFPHTAAHLGGLDQWQVLLWAANRVELPGQESQIGWRWRGAPLGE